MNIVTWLSERLLVDEDEMWKFIKTAPHRYKVYKIKKRSGTGFRIIAQPTEVLKNIQRMVLSEFLSNLPIHDCAAAYKHGIGIKENAAAHAENAFLLKMDFSDFFPSIKPKDLTSHVAKHVGRLDSIDEYALRKIFFWSDKKDRDYKLSIGAPSSPFLSNSLLYEFDCIVYEYCSSRQVVYTRYADDLTFSTCLREVLFEIPDFIKNLLNSLSYPDLKVNEGKTIFSSKKHNRHVTGLVLNNEGEVSLGRGKKRHIKSLVYKCKCNSLEDGDIESLKGMLAFSKHVEPTFYRSLIKKYGYDLISFIVGHPGS